MAAYTSGNWRVKAGREQEFISAWREAASWSGAEFDPMGWAKLLRDKDNPSHFVSIGEWADESAIERWRNDEEFKNRFVALAEFVEEVDIHPFEVAAEAS